MKVQWETGDVFDRLATLEDESVDLVVTSPPFLALRSYLPADHPDKGKEIGSEPTPAAFIDTMLALTAEWRRLLAPHGSIAVELGDTYSGSGGAGGDYAENGLREWQPKYRQNNLYRGTNPEGGFHGSAEMGTLGGIPLNGGPGWPLTKSKTLIPELYRIALAYGIHPLTGQPSPAGSWRIRNVVTWARPNPPVGALGDKWRPATSDVVVACVSDKRYWDDLATRRPHSDNTHRRNAAGVQARDNTTPSGQRDGNWNTLAITDDQNPAGAPLLDYWVIPPTGYKGAHYAVYPPALVEPLVKAMAPPKVCRTCGEPSRRIVENGATYERDSSERKQYQRTADHAGRLTGTGADFISAEYTTTGWTDCGHGSIVCRACNGLVPYDGAVRRPREAPPIQGGVGQEEVLGEPVQGPDGQTETPEGVRGLRSGLSGEDDGLPGVQPFLFGEAGPHGGADELIRSGPEQSSMEGRQEGQPPGLRPGVGAGGVSGETEERLHDGASPSDAGASRPTPGTVGVGTPPERGEGGQPDRESGDSDPRQANGRGDLPELQSPVPGALEGYVCPCGSSDLKYVADHWRPGRILDPFAGSGTTLQVATGHGFDAIGIDLDSRNLELARQRVGFFLDEGATQ